jgi:integrase
MRNARGLGSWFQRGSIWYIKYYKNGKPFKESTHSRKETDAIQLLKQRHGEISQGSFTGSGYKKITFENLCQDLLEDYRINQRKSLWRVELSVNHLKEFFGGMKACVIDTPFIRRYIASRQSYGAKNATINRELAAMRRMFRLAAQDDRMPRVPHFPMLQENNVRTGFLEHNQYQKLLGELPDYLRPVLIMAYWTGCRKSEILNLIWSQVDLLNRQIALEPKGTKNNEPRIIPMAEELYQTILALHPGDQHGGAAKGLVFTNHGRPIRFIYNAWREAVKRAGLPGLLLHDCRRTTVRNLVRAGVPEKIATTITGHKTRSVFDRYNIVVERDLRDAAVKLEHHLAKTTVPVWAQSDPTEGNLKDSSNKESEMKKVVTH